MKKLIAIIMVMSLITACQTGSVDPTPDIHVLETEAFQKAWAALTPQTPEAVLTIEPTIEPGIEPTQVPDVTNEALGEGSGEQIAWNYLASQESGGITVDIARVVFANKKDINQDFIIISAFDDTPVIGEIIFKVKNNSQQVLNVNPDQGTVVVATEQIPLKEWMTLATFGESVGGDISPGMTKIGGLWFGLKNTPLEDIQNMTISFSGPSTESNDRTGPDFNFALDLSNRQNQEVPEELK